MDLQADISWIRSELKSVTDPHLVEAFKQLLTYRKAKSDLTTSFFSTTKQDLQKRAESSLESVKEGNTRNISEFKKEVESWKNRQAI